MADEERVYTIPLRREFLKAPKWKRTKRAINITKEFLMKHMKSKDVRIGKYLNQLILSRGRKNPPGKVKVKVWKEEEKVVAELVDAPAEEKIEKPKIKEEVKEEKEETKKEKEEKEKREILKKGLWKQ